MSKIIKILKNIQSLSYYMYYHFRYGITIRPNSSDLECFNQMFVYKNYELEKELKPKLIIDGGSNIGFSSIYFSIKYPNAKIIAIEPDKKNYIKLLENIKRFKNIFPLNVGLWNKETYLRIINPKGDTMGFITEETSKKSNDSIKAMNINSLLKKEDKIDILKLDIEGSEREVFSSNYLEWLNKTQIIFIEVHDIIKYGSSENLFSAIKDYNNSINNKNTKIIMERQRGENMIFKKIGNNKK